MRKRLLTAIVIGAVATGLGGALATAALASSGPASAQPAAAASVRLTAQQPVSREVVAARTGMSPANKQLLRIQEQIKKTVVGPTAAQVAEANRLVNQLKTDGRATEDQLAWLALTPAEKRVEAAPVGRN